jgi:hypothetical protein
MQPTVRSPLRFAVLPLVLFACAAPTEDRGCAVPAERCPGGLLSSADLDQQSLDIALGSVASMTLPASYQGDGEVTVTVRSSAPDVLLPLEDRVTVAQCGAPSVRVKALKEGTATLSFAFPDFTTRVRSAAVTLPAKVEIVPFLEDVVSSVASRGEPLPAADTREIVQMAGGKMLWRARYTSAAGKLLRGTGATTYTLPRGATASPFANRKDRELFALSTLAGANGTLGVRAPGASLDVPLRVVPAEAITTLKLFVEDEVSTTGGEGDAGAARRLGVLARALDATGATVYGAPFTFALGSETARPGGEVLQYDFAPSAPKQPLVVTVAGSPARAETTISAASPAKFTRLGGEDLAGCSFGAGRHGASSFGACVALVGLFLGVRRRRVRGAPAGVRAPTRPEGAPALTERA